MVVALLTNFGAGLVAARVVQAERRREADLAAELARLMLRATDLRSALGRAGEHLAQALKLRFAKLELEDVTGDEGHSAITLRDGETVLGALVVPADLPRATQQRLRTCWESLRRRLRRAATACGRVAARVVGPSIRSSPI
jgi:hypothetical protein